MLDARHFVAGGAVVFRELGFDDHLGIELVGHDEVRCLVEPGDFLSALGLSIADACLCQDFLDRGIHVVADELVPQELLQVGVAYVPQGNRVFYRFDGL